MTSQSIAERKRRHVAFWNHEPVDRPLTLIQLPSPGHTTDDQELESLKAADLQHFGSDPDILIRRAKQGVRNTNCLGDTLPLMAVPFGPTMLAALLGARVEVAPDTVWFHPTIDDLADLEYITFDPSNRWWKIIEECAIRIAREPGAIPVVLDFGSTADNLAALIGSETLVMEMLERPDLVKKVLRRMANIAADCCDKLFAIAETAGNGTANWLHLWSPKRTGILQNDFSIMLSTPMYQEFFAEEFETLCRVFDHRLFHVDGTRSQQHIPDFIGCIPGLHGCQLGSNPGTRAMEILPVIKMLQARGKCVYTYVFPDEIEALFSEISPAGVAVVTWAKTEDDANEFIRRATAACARRSVG